jgi:hypothetical protein
MGPACREEMLKRVAKKPKIRGEDRLNFMCDEDNFEYFFCCCYYIYLS